MGSPDANPGPSLADRLKAARHHRFIGRASEIEMFRSAIDASPAPFAVLAIHGPGGTGKSMLLGEFGGIAEQAGIRTVRLDARYMDPSPPGFLHSLRLALALPDDAPPLVALRESERSVLLIDTCELLSPLEDWLREELLPQLPANCVTVTAGRNPPDIAWRAAPGWRDLIRILPLRNLSPDESRAYIRKREVPERNVDSVLNFTHGHPLALSLVADAAIQDEVSFDPAAKPDIVRTLLELFVEREPSSLHRDALDMSAHARITTEGLLAYRFGESRGHELFSWLQGLTFMDHSGEGLFPHDLIRDVLEADLRWRNPERYVEVHGIVHSYIIERVLQTQGMAQQQAIHSLMFLHRHNPVWRRYHADDEYGRTYVAPVTAEEIPLVLDMVRRHEGNESAAIARQWYERFPAGFLLIRTAGGIVKGFLGLLMLDDLAPGDLDFDPAIRPVPVADHPTATNSTRDRPNRDPADLLDHADLP